MVLLLLLLLLLSESLDGVSLTTRCSICFCLPDRRKAETLTPRGRRVRTVDWSDVGVDLLLVGFISGCASMGDGGMGGSGIRCAKDWWVDGGTMASALIEDERRRFALLWRCKGSSLANPTGRSLSYSLTGLMASGVVRGVILNESTEDRSDKLLAIPLLV